jgi:cyclopropane-fatty-acyl-phospholipid synthase
LCEHIGYKNYRKFFQLIRDRLKDDGLALVHTIGTNLSMYTTNAWLDKYIFPGSLIPSPSQLSKAFNKILVLEDWHNFGPDYDKTLMAWWDNFNKNWESLKSDKYNDRFFRMWKYYLQICAGSFRGRWNQLWQLVLSKKGLVSGYESIR